MAKDKRRENKNRQGNDGEKKSKGKKIPPEGVKPTAFVTFRLQVQKQCH